MGWWWEAKVTKASFVETLHKTTQLIEQYEKYEFGICNLMPVSAYEKVQNAAAAVKKLDKCTIYLEDMQKAYTALKVLNNSKTARDPEMAAKAYGQLLQVLGNVISDLPSPANIYGKPLSVIGAKFERIVGVLMPSAHGSGLDSDLKDFLQGGQKFINGV